MDFYPELRLYLPHGNALHALYVGGTSVADPETSERGGGQDTWNISHSAQQPSFYDYFLQAGGWGGVGVRHGFLGLPWISFCTRWLGSMLDLMNQKKF